VMSQHREVAEGRTPSRPWPLMSILMGTPPEAKPAPSADMKKSQFDLERFLEAARRAVPVRPDSEGRAVPAPLYVMGGDWDATQGPPADVRLVMDLGEQASGADVERRAMAFMTEWLKELKKTDVVETADTVVGPVTLFHLVFPSRGGKRVWSVPVHLRVVRGSPLAAVVADLETRPRNLWDRVRRILRAEWLFGDPDTHARWLKTFHEQKKLNRAGEVFGADPAFRAAQERWLHPRAAVEALGPAAALALERATDRRLPGGASPVKTPPAGPVLRDNPVSAQAFLSLLQKGSRLDKNIETEALPAAFRESLGAFTEEGYLANPTQSGRWDLYFRGARRYFRFVKLAGADYWKMGLDWRPGWGLILTMSAGQESRVFLVNNYADAVAAKPTVVLSPHPTGDLAVVVEERRLQNARAEALNVLERAVSAMRENREEELRVDIEKDMDVFNAAALPFPVGTRRKGVRPFDHLLTLVRGDNRRLNFQNSFLTGDTVAMELLWPRGHHPVVLLTRADGRTLAFAVERFFGSLERNREIGANPLWEFPNMAEARARVPRYFNLAKALDEALAEEPPSHLRKRLATAQNTTLLCETGSFTLFRSDGSRVATLVFRAPGDYTLRLLLPKSGVEVVANAGDHKQIFTLGRLARAGQMGSVVGTPAGETSRVLKGLLTEALEPLLLAVSQPGFLNFWEEPLPAAARRKEFNQAAWTVRADGQGQVPLTFSERLGGARQMNIPAVLTPNAPYVLKLEWFRAGGYVLSLEGKEGVHAFALGRLRRAMFEGGGRRSVTAVPLGRYANRSEMRLEIEKQPALLLRRAELAGRQRTPDPELMGRLREAEWFWANNESGKHLWENPFEGFRWNLHGVGALGRTHRVRLNVVDGVGAVLVFEYEGPEEIKSRFKIYTRFSSAARRDAAKRDVQLFPLKGKFFHPDEVARAIGALRPNGTDAVFVEGAPDTPEKMRGALERLIAAYAPPVALRGTAAAVFPLEGPRATRDRARSSGRFLVLLNRNGVAGF
ncbi:MAG: hypothetical protein KA044_09360, partial [Elusimicrobia bacterium]|nr:hypothetical protein [Elusimicrobiota bacterium]